MPLTTLARALWREGRREASWLRDLARRSPTEIVIETTRACNLRCLHCAVGEPGYHVATLGWEAFQRTLPFLRRHHPLVHLNGHGETLLHGRFTDMFRAVIECGCRVGFQTNGMLLTPELTRRLLEGAPPGRFAYVRFSVDAADKPLFDEIRAQGDFDTLLANARFLKEEKARRGLAAPEVQLEMCAMQINVHHLPALVRLTHELGGTELCVSDILEYARARGQRLAWDPARAVPFRREAEQTARELGVTLSIMPELAALLERAAAGSAPNRAPDSGGEPATPPAPHRPDAPRPVPLAAEPPGRSAERPWRVRECRDPWRMAFVGGAGDVRPCCVVSLPMGSVARQDLDEIWRGDRFRVFRRMLASRSPLPRCSTCFMREWAPMPLVVRMREALAQATRWVGPIRARGATRFSLAVSAPTAHRGEVVTVAVSVAPGRLGCGGLVDAYVSFTETDGARTFLDGSGFSARPAPLLLGWEPFAVDDLALATLRVPATWRADHMTLALTVIPHGTRPDDPTAPSHHDETTIAVAPR